MDRRAGNAGAGMDGSIEVTANTRVQLVKRNKLAHFDPKKTEISSIYWLKLITTATMTKSDKKLIQIAKLSRTSKGVCCFMNLPRLIGPGHVEPQQPGGGGAMSQQGLVKLKN